MVTFSRNKTFEHNLLQTFQVLQKKFPVQKVNILLLCYVSLNTISTIQMFWLPNIRKLSTVFLETVQTDNKHKINAI